MNGWKEERIVGGKEGREKTEKQKGKRRKGRGTRRGRGGGVEGRTWRKTSSNGKFKISGAVN